MRVHVPNALLRADAVVVLRSASTGDTEGNPNTGRTTVDTVTRATWRELSPQEQTLATQRGTKMSREFAFRLGSDVRGGDWIKLVDGSIWEVVEANDLRSHRRALTRRTK